MNDIFSIAADVAAQEAEPVPGAASLAPAPPTGAWDVAAKVLAERTLRDAR
jgi:hypothetical protein